MPRDFDQCASSGGRVRTKHTSSGKCIKICYSGGKSHAGHSFKCKSSSNKSRPGKHRARGGKK